jgi:hypothetical protein
MASHTLAWQNVVENQTLPKTWPNTHSILYRNHSKSILCPQEHGEILTTWNMVVISGIWYTKKIWKYNFPWNNKLPSTSMHTTLATIRGSDLSQTMRGMKWITRWRWCWYWGWWRCWWRIPPYVKEELVTMMVAISPRQGPQSNMICPLLE